jgi:hypothetical protein
MSVCFLDANQLSLSFILSESEHRYAAEKRRVCSRDGPRSSSLRVSGRVAALSDSVYFSQP